MIPGFDWNHDIVVFGLFLAIICHIPLDKTLYL